METIMSVENITKEFGGLKAVNNLSFQVHEGDILGLIGPNGSGKTTTINMLTGLYPVSSGRIMFQDACISQMRPHKINRCGVARTFQNIRLFPSLTVKDNILAARYYESHINLLDILFGGKKNKRLQHARSGYEELIQLVKLEDKIDCFADELPYGQQKCLEIARALATGPKFLLLDEPAAGLNATEVNFLKDMIVKIKEMGITVLVVEHHMDLIMEICNRIVVLNYGEKIAEGTPKEIQNNSDVIEAYLGSQYREQTG